MPPGLTSLTLPVRGGACHLWAGRHLPAASTEALPLLVGHGGPGVPSDYLFPLVEILQRPVIFFDQLGCERSDRPEPADQEYSITTSVRDLAAVILMRWWPRRGSRCAMGIRRTTSTASRLAASWPLRPSPRPVAHRCPARCPSPTW